MSPRFASFANGEALPLGRVPRHPFPLFQDHLRSALEEGHRLLALWGDKELNACVLLAGPEGRLQAAQSRFPDGAFPSLARTCHEAHLFEREVAEQWGLVPEGHPWLKPVRNHAPWRLAPAIFPASETGGQRDFYRVEGPEIHEVAVGPVHAGVIEPGHFRFQCHGETVFHLEIALGYQHRGIERALQGGPHPRTLKHMETLAGDTTVGHAWAHALVCEGLGQAAPPVRAQLLRGIALELERLANHTGDLGALAGDVGFLPTSAYCGRLRGDWLNLTALLCGSRLGRDLLVPGGVRFDLEPLRLHEMRERLEDTARDTRDAVELLWKTPSVLARFEGTGRVTPHHAAELGLVGPSARACGLDRDARRDTPFGPYVEAQIPVSLEDSGDVQARARVRTREIEASVDFLRWALDTLAELPEGPLRTDVASPQPYTLAVGITEGWRGEIVHAAITDAAGRFRSYKIVDPSFRNWHGLAMALRGEAISDFPLCNKSFNLSYCGFDL